MLLTNKIIDQPLLSICSSTSAIIQHKVCDHAPAIKETQHLDSSSSTFTGIKNSKSESSSQ